MGDLPGHPFRGNQYTEHGGVAYFKDLKGAEDVAASLRASGSPEARVVSYDRGHAVQHNKSGTYFPEPRGNGPFSGRGDWPVGEARTFERGKIRDEQGRHVADDFKEAAPDMDHLARENAIPVNAAAVEHFPGTLGTHYAGAPLPEIEHAEALKANVDALYKGSISEDAFHEKQRRLWDAAEAKGRDFSEKVAREVAPKAADADAAYHAYRRAAEDVASARGDAEHKAELNTTLDRAYRDYRSSLTPKGKPAGDENTRRRELNAALRERRETDRARMAALISAKSDVPMTSALRQRLGVTSPPRVAIRAGTHRDKPGFRVSGKDTMGRSVKIFTESRSSAEHIREKVRMGRGIDSADFAPQNKKRS
jgi:hypothetical protein